MQKKSSPLVFAIILTIMGLIFSAVGGGIAFFKGLPTVIQARASTDWPTTKGVVTSSKVISSHSDGSTTYRAEVLYKYTIKGEKLESERVWFGDGISTSGGKDARKTVRDYPVGKKVTIYYDPDDLLETCLLPGAFYSTYFFLIFGGIFLGVGLIMLISPVFKLLTFAFAIFVATKESGPSAKEKHHFTIGSDPENPYDPDADAEQKNSSSNDPFDIS